MKIILLGLVLMTKMLNAAEVTVHYNRLGGCEGWNLWVWNEEEQKPGFELKPDGTDAYGAVYKLDTALNAVEGRRIGLLPRRGEWAEKDSPDRFFTPKGAGQIYLLEGDPVVYAAPPEISTRVTGAWLDGDETVRVAFNRPVDAAYAAAQDFVLHRGDLSYTPVKARLPGEAKYARAALLDFEGMGKPAYAIVNNGGYKLTSRELGTLPLELGGAMYSEDFYSAAPMGAFNEGGKTAIRIFAPKAVKAEVLVYDSVSAEPVATPMSYKGRGLWEKHFGVPLDGKYYRLRVNQGGKTYTGLDPYAGCVTRDDGLALIGGEATPVMPGPAFDLSEAVLYEVHLRDLTMDEFSGVVNKGKYLGAAEAGTRHAKFADITTGLDHLAELGVNTIHIMPFQDFENGDSTTAYNWGYMPVNFNSPEGAYATSTDGFSRVREAKLMINAFHKKGLKVIMDVVYNHTAETRAKAYSFNALAADYYYRTKADGSYSDGSGCGNEFNTEAPMARKFLVDSLLHWVREYKVDGFRFDLMGLIDLGAVDELVKTLKAEKPDIIIYGEPWAAGATPTDGVKKGSQRSKGYSVFGDGFRDAIKGSVFDVNDLGYVQAGKSREAVMKGIRGSVEDFTDGPLEALNYVSCHDNNTLWDRIDISAKDATYGEKVKMDKLANALVLTSQGIPFLHAGEEFLRTKGGEHNSYNLPDSVNKLDWTRKKENLAVFNYYKDLIALRKAHPALRMKTASEVKKNLKFYEELGLKVEEPGIAYVLYGDKEADAWGKLAVLVNPARTPMKFVLPTGKWWLAFDGEGLYRGEGVKVKEEYEVPALTLVVLRR